MLCCPFFVKNGLLVAKDAILVNHERSNAQRNDRFVNNAKRKESSAVEISLS